MFTDNWKSFTEAVTKFIPKSGFNKNMLQLNSEKDKESEDDRVYRVPELVKPIY